MTRKKAISPRLVEWAWLALRQAAARQGKTWRPKLSDARYKLIEAALRQASPHEVARAVDGFVVRSSEWNPEIREKSFNPEYILRSTKLDLHVEAGILSQVTSQGVTVTQPEVVPSTPSVSVEQNIAEAHELRALGFYGTVGEH